MLQHKLLFFFFLVVSFSFAQTSISGIVSNEEEKAVDNVSILLYDQLQNKVLGYTFSDDLGAYKFPTPLTEGIYKMEYSKMGYKKTIQEIVIGTDSTQNLQVDIELSTQAFELGEVVLQGRNPILVKKDTIMYDIDKLRDKHDESLEEVLAKIEGIKILPNGDIEINGKVIQKVLIDGKETSDFGSALIVKNLSADKVENVEVRFDEKNTKIKESLLDDGKFVVLDITLKKDFNQSLFGKQQLRIGQQNNTKIGGLTNLFSLNKKINLQLFAEVDHFGRNEIELSQIRNIGADAFAKNFSTPVDIDDIKQRAGYQEEIYGFDNFTVNDKSILGLSVNLPLSEKTDLYLGSFNDYQFLRNQYSRELFFENTLLNDYQENNQNTAYSSKSKLQLKHTSDRFKLDSDVNFVYSDQKISNLAQSEFLNDFGKNHYSKDWYANNRMEYLILENFGFSETFSYSRENFNLQPILKTEDLAVLDFFGLDTSDFFYQRNNNKQTILNNELQFTYKTKFIGNHSLGYQYTKNTLDNEKHSNVADFSAERNKYWSETHSLRYTGSIFLGPVYLNLTLKNSFIDFPFETIEKSRKQKSYFEYDAQVNYDLDMQTNLSLSSSKMVSLFPLQKITLGNILTDFQTVFTPTLNVQPYYNTNFMASFNKVFYRQGEIILAYLYGKAENLDNQKLQDNLIFNQANQLSNKFHLISTQFEKQFNKRGVTARLEPEMILSSSEFIYDENIENSKAYQYFLGLKLGYKASEKLRFSYYPKYSYFVFENSLHTDIEKTFDFLTNNFTVHSYLLDQNLKLEMNFKQVNFLQSNADFNNLDFKAVYKWEKYRVFLELSNLFNSKNFITQDLDKTLLNINNNHVFGRFINLGIEMKIN